MTLWSRIKRLYVIPEPPPPILTPREVQERYNRYRRAFQDLAILYSKRSGNRLTGITA